VDLSGFLVEAVDDCIVFDLSAEDVGGATRNVAVEVVGVLRGTAGEVAEVTREDVDVVGWVIRVEGGEITCAVIGDGVVFTGGMEEGVIAVFGVADIVGLLAGVGLVVGLTRVTTGATLPIAGVTMFLEVVEATSRGVVVVT